VNIYSSMWFYNPWQQLGEGRGLAVSFMVHGSDDYQFTSVAFFGARSSDPSGPNFNLSIVSDDNGRPSETVLETVAVDPTTIPVSDRGEALFASSLQPVLAAGATYWLRVQPNALDTGSWTNNDSYCYPIPSGSSGTPVATRRYDLADGQWLALEPGVLGTPAFRVEADPIPEPGALALLAAAGGLRLLFLRCWRKHSQVASASRSKRTASGRCMKGG
jgi:hypothetical protein